MRLPGATKDAASVKRLLIRLRDHGLATDRTDRFVMDGAKALRAGQGSLRPVAK